MVFTVWPHTGPGRADLLRRFRLSIYSDYSLHTLLGIPADHSKNLFLSNLHIDYDYAIAISREAYAPFTSRQTCL